MVAVTITAGMMASSRVISRRKTGGRRMRRKPSITTWPASVPVSVEFWPEASRATAKSVLATPTPRRGLKSLGVLDFCHLVMPALIEARAGHDKNCSVYKERKQKRHSGINCSEEDSFALPLDCQRIMASL